jgi:hypothetical protein
LPGEIAISHRCMMSRGCSTANNSIQPSTFDAREIFLRSAGYAEISLSFIKGLTGHWGG